MDAERPKDILGYEIFVGSTVVRGVRRRNSGTLELAEVTKVDDRGRVFLDNSKTPVYYTDRLAIVKGH